MSKDFAAFLDALNKNGAAYVVIGGMAVLSHIPYRTTRDIDVLIEPTLNNARRVRKAVAEYAPASQSRQLLLRIGLALSLCLAWACSSGQRADSEFSIEAENPAYGEGKGPVVLVDAAHHNFHTADGRYQAFAELLRSDGYLVRSNHARFDKAALEAGQILVISNALSEKDAQWEDWPNPTYPAFEDEEVEAVRQWVEEGGSLLLIADHMPMPAAAENLAAAFGVRFNNGYAVHQDRSGNRPPLKFRRAGSGEPGDGVLGSHPITEGRNASERVNVVASFTGQAFQADEGTPLMVFGPSIVSLMTEVPAQFEEDTPRVDVEGWYQGLAMQHGQGRVAFFGEAAMFTAQISGAGNPMGMNSPHAPENAQFLLNVMHWLSGLLD